LLARRFRLRIGPGRRSIGGPQIRNAAVRLQDALRIDPDMQILNPLVQPRELVKGKPVADLWARDTSRYETCQIQLAP
jgi:hypothetical protein